MWKHGLLSFDDVLIQIVEKLQISLIPHIHIIRTLSQEAVPISRPFSSDKPCVKTYGSVVISLAEGLEEQFGRIDSNTTIYQGNQRVTSEY